MKVGYGMIYLYLGIAFSIMSFLEIFSKDRHLKFFLFYYFVLFLILFAGLRDGTSVGTDSPAYYQFYLTKNPTVEVGYKIINDFFSSMSIDYNIFLLCLNFVLLFNISKFIKLNSSYLLFPLFIYYSDFYFYFNFSGIRQATALSFTALSIFYIFNDKKLKASLLILIASLFHVTALVFFIAFFLPKEKIDIRKYFKFLFFVGLAFLIGEYIINSVPYLSGKFLYYTTLQEQADDIVNSYFVGAVRRLFVLIGVILIYRNFFNDNKNIYLYNIYLVGFLIYLLSYLISPEFGVRLGSYFTIVDCILIARYIQFSKSFTNKVVIFIFFTLIAIYKIYTYTQIPTFEYKLLVL